MTTLIRTSFLGSGLFQPPGETLVTQANSDDDGVSYPWGVQPQPTSGERYVYTDYGIERVVNTTAGYVRGDVPAGGPRGQMLFKWTVAGAPAGVMTLGNIRAIAPTADQQLASPAFLTDKRIQMRYGTGNTAYTASNSPVLEDGDYWVLATVNCGSTSTTGQVGLKIFAADTLEPIHEFLSPSNLSIPAAEPGLFRFGTWSSSTGGSNYPVHRLGDDIPARRYVRWGTIDAADGDIPFLHTVGETPPVPQAYFSPDGTTVIPVPILYSPDGTLTRVIAPV